MFWNQFRDELVETVYALWVIACHLLMALGALLGVWVIDYVIHFLWPESEPTLFGKIPLRMVIETAEGGILIVFLVFGLYRVAMAMRSRL